MSKTDVSRKGIVDVTLTVGQLLNLKQGFDALRAMKMKGGKGARRIGKVLAVLRGEFQDYSDTRNELIEEHGQKSEDGKGFEIAKDNKRQSVAYYDALREVEGEPVDLSFRPITVVDFGNVEIPLLVISDLSIFFDFQEDEVEEKPAEPKAVKKPKGAKENAA